MSGRGDIAISVEAMKAGAIDFLVKPFSNEELLCSVKAAFARLFKLNEASRCRDHARQRCSTLSEHERELIISGLCNSKVAEHLGQSIRTVETHGANINKKTGATTLAELVRLADQCRQCLSQGQG
jgi:two-component system response regulator FixJ